MKTKFLLPFFLLLLFSCKKTKLDGELAILIGEWRWKHTLIIEDRCDASFVGPVLLYDPTSVGYDYTMKFIQKGKLEIRKTGERKKKYRLIEEPGVVHDPADTVFAFHLDKKNGKGFAVEYHKIGNIEYLYSNDLPLGLVNGSDGCKGIRSVFEKVN